ncbi:NAD-glutamate dehydrogenase [Roseomonas sp. OT10]|uniref:NAD-glutamate dehydrogenase n=1 Tax=Roseomonas cutis TaxID=2897332 RepID=UPI001E395DF1|nr:NAD-glutamate dehydrogenase domain-containing protein [Roseomonas sp. OT10]UFN50514.1 NAD-glutamate dehydrogenase [Roseomonas sp. OT10]
MPQDLAPPPADSLRREVLRDAAGELRRLAPALPADAVALLHALFDALPTAELAAEPPEAIAQAAASLWDLAAAHRPGAASVRLHPPGQGSAAAVAEIVTEDMPFLVDSAMAALTLTGRTVRRLLHPVVATRRDAEGRLLGLTPAGEGAPESMMRIEIAPAPARLLGAGVVPASDWAAVEEALTRAMAEVRLAVDDFPAMLERLREAEREVAAAPDGAEAAEFLRWLVEGNFVLLGHRRLDLDPLRAGEGLGLLRDASIPVFDALRDLSAVAPGVRGALAEPVAMTVAKANLRTRVHRPSHCDVVATKIFEGGKVVAVRAFLGLFAADAYNRNPRFIPWLASKVKRVLEMTGAAPDSHDERAFRHILDTWPRDELFQASEAEILAGARRAVDLQLRPRPALYVRPDPFERFVSAIAWLPRDTFDTRLRERVGRLVAGAYAGRLSAFYIALGDGPLARIHYVIGTTPGALPEVEVDALEAAVVQAARPFADRLSDALSRGAGEAEAARLLARWGGAFPAAYREEATASRAVADLQLAEAALASGRPAAHLSRAPGEGARRLMLRLANPGGPLPLADMLPLFEALDLRAIEENPHRLAPEGADPVVLHVFGLEAGAEAPEHRFPALLEALDALLDGRAEADGFDRLVLRAGLDWRECWLLRAMARWLKQVGFAFAPEAIAAALCAQPRAAQLLLDLFQARFDPDRPRDAAREAQLSAEWDSLLEANTDAEADRILTRLRTLLDAVLRTNFHQGHDRLVLKIDSAAAGEMPAPRPWREIFVHAVSMEGCHLRAGPVARGGIRWSDRREDFRTEILGLMKAQRLKNVIIVPTGAKGGFVLKGAVPTDREGFLATGQAAYRQLVRGMLDVTDNLRGQEVVPPERVVRRDGDDPYIVAAADKGTATFSDIANGLSAEYGFWLGDAFASGGSQGYDHKAMGITAKGAWVMVARHFREMGHDIQAEPFTCAGVGDMSGDVFGNGLLVSRQTKLVAAFDHRHIFLDPDPDPAASYEERARLFALPRSSWDDYDRARISAGGGVFPRNAKTVPLSPEARALLGIAAERPDPATVMRAILKLDVDLLYFGGIGTYLKASTESQAEAGDRANDALRIDGAEVRAKVIGEGANLAVTQAGRIEAARRGVRLNTDALDNSAGVSTSDHEVNIKILLADVTASGLLTRRQRDDLLAEMTGEVGALVLLDNTEQGLAVSLEQAAGAEALPAQAALMTRLEAAGLMDRAVIGLPSAEAMAERIAAGEALTRPEIAALLPVAKLWLNDAIGESGLPDEPALEALLLDYFPTPLRERFGEQIGRHRLRRELVATVLANSVANRIGPAGLARLAAEAELPAVARAAWLADALFGIDPAARAIDSAPAPWPVRRDALLALRRLQEAAARGIAGGAEAGLSLAEALERLRPGVDALVEAAAAEPARDLPEGPARLAAAAPGLLPAVGVLRLAAVASAAPAEAAAAWTQAGRQFGLEALRHAAQAAPVTGAFGSRARAALLDELDAAQARLAGALLADQDPSGGPGAAEALRTVREAALVPDLSAVTVGLRALARLLPPSQG